MDIFGYHHVTYIWSLYIFLTFDSSEYIVVSKCSDVIKVDTLFN